MPLLVSLDLNIQILSVVENDAISDAQ